MSGPLSILHDRPVALAEDRPLTIALVLPDREVLTHARRELFGGLARRIAAVRRRRGEDPAHLDVLGVDRCRGRQERRVPLDAQDAEAQAESLAYEVAVGADGALVRAVDEEVVVGNRVGAVHVHEVREVDVVLRHLLTARRDVELDDLVGEPLVVAQLGNIGHFVERLAAVTVVPRPDHLVALEARERTHLRLRRNAIHIAVRDLGAFAARTVVEPAVERATNASTFDAATRAEVRPQVRAVGLDHVRCAVGGAEQHDVAAEHVHRARLAGHEVTRFGDDEPAVRYREREARLGRGRAHDGPAAPVDQRLRIEHHAVADHRQFALAHHA